MKEMNPTVCLKKSTISSLVLCSLLTYQCFAQTGGDYKLTWSTIDGGGGRSSGGNYTVVGTIGQPDAGGMTDREIYEAITLQGGFWPGGPICIINLEDLLRLAAKWLDTPCNGEDNNWCEGADINHSSSVDLIDFGKLAYFWLCKCPADWPWR